VKLVFTELARQDLIRLREFIAEKNPGAAQRAAARIKAASVLLTRLPFLGRVVRAPPSSALDVRELPIAFGASGYL
jgi:plasmid stabilization system protein ParE